MMQHPYSDEWKIKMLVDGTQRGGFQDLNGHIELCRKFNNNYEQTKASMRREMAITVERYKGRRGEKFAFVANEGNNSESGCSMLELSPVGSLSGQLSQCARIKRSRTKEAIG
jgi:hypothetical protein